MNKLKVLTISIILVISLLWAGTSFDVSARPLTAASAPPLGAAASFSVLAATSAASANMTTTSGDLGLSPGLAVSRTGPWLVGGSEYFGPAPSLSASAQTDALGAFNNMVGQASDGVWGVNPWSPVPGVWTDAGSPVFTGTITLSGGYDDVWVFQVGTDMTFSGSVVMGGNAQPCHVFWQIGRDATIAVGSTFVGTLIASRDITLVSGATVDGRIISLNRDLTVDANTITGPSCAAAPAPPPPDEPTPTPLPGVSGLPSTGGALPIGNEDFPWSLVIVGGFSAMALTLGVRAYRRTHLPRQ